MNQSHEERVLKAISDGASRPAQIVKKTCLGADHVKAALAQLRKARRVEKTEDGYKVTDGQA